MNGIKGIVIDPGHGGSDPGAVGNGFQEKELNLKISRYMYDQFENLGIPVTLTRATDESLTPTQRTNLVKQAYGNTPDVLVISNHINAAGTEQSEAEGAEVIYALRNKDTLAKNILEKLGEAGQVTRKYYQRRLPSNPEKDYYFMMRDTINTTPVIVEYGFIDNAEDINRVNNNYQKYVDAVVEAVIETYGGIPSGNTYTVKNGDSLWKIATQFGTTVTALKELNNLTSDSLSIGQVLKLPSSPSGTTPSGNTYTVKSGDSLWTIARRYDTTVDTLKQLNGLSNNNLTIGQILKVPQVTGNITLPANPTPSGSTYTVKSGDSLWKIANQYGTSVATIKTLNNLTSDSLSIGQVLKVPSTSSNIIYTVKNGDSLWKIANQYGTTVADLKNFNNLVSNNLTIGQQLKIPRT